MADQTLFVQAQTFYLAGSGISLSATSIILKKFKLPADSTDTETSIAMTDFGDIGYGVIEPGTSREETISFTGVTQNGDGTATLTGVTRGLKFNDDYTADSNRRFAHAGGAAFIISNPAVFYSQFAVKDNDETISGTFTYSTLPATTAGNPTGDNQFARKAYVDATATGTTNIDRIVVAATAGATVAAGELVYFDSVTANEWILADADAAATSENVLLGIAQGAGTDGNAISGGVLLQGLDSNQSGMTAGNVMYASDTAGAIASSAGTKEVTVGIAKSATELYFSPRLDQQITEDQQDALAGTSGTPSASNKYVTNADTTASPTADAVVRYTSGGVLPLNIYGDGSDGALSVTSGTTTLNDAPQFGNTRVYEYTSISISAGATLDFGANLQNKIIILKSQGDVTINGTIDASGMGGAGGAGGTAGKNHGAAGTEGANIWDTKFDTTDRVHAGAASSAPAGGVAVAFLTGQNSNVYHVAPASGGGGGQGGLSVAGGAGGAGGGGLMIICGGDLTYGASSTVTVAGVNGSAGSNQATDNRAGAGGGGGAGGQFLCLYAGSLTDSGATYTIDGGDGGAGGDGATGTGDGGNLTSGSGGGHDEPGADGVSGGATNGTAGSGSAGGAAGAAGSGTHGGPGGSGGGEGRSENIKIVF